MQFVTCVNPLEAVVRTSSTFQRVRRFFCIRRTFFFTIIITSTIEEIIMRVFIFYSDLRDLLQFR